MSCDCSTHRVERLAPFLIHSEKQRDRGHANSYSNNIPPPVVQVYVSALRLVRKMVSDVSYPPQTLKVEIPRITEKTTELNPSNVSMRLGASSCHHSSGGLTIEA